MNSGLKAAIFNPQSHFIHLRAALFHSTPVLERKRRSYWHSHRSHHNSNSYSKRFRRTQSKQSLLRNISAYADYLFQSWQEELNDDDDPSSTRGTSWFKKDCSGGSKKAQNQGHQRRGRRGIQFCEDEEEFEVDVERVFESMFGQQRRHYRWSFVYEENTRSRSSSSFGNNYWNSQSWRSRVEEDYDSSGESELETSESDMASDRQALGLSASGPLKLEDVKTAYRACALTWHPDRHHGSSKVIAEEKFKLCSAAYQSLCDKMAVN